MVEVKKNRPAFWSWVGQHVFEKPDAGNKGRYSRPLSERDKATMVAFGMVVKKLRVEAGYSTYALAKLAHLSQPSIINVEHGRQNLEVRLVYDFAEVFNLKVEALFAMLHQHVMNIEKEWNGER